MHKKTSLTLCVLLTLASINQVGCTFANSVMKGASTVAADLLIPVSEENKLGLKFSSEVSKEMKMSTNSEIVKYVQGLGSKIVSAAKRKREIPKGIKFKFYVVDDPKTVNAFALPGGHIYMYTGLLLKAENEAEVISVLAHEVAHVTKRHIAQSLVATYGLQTVTALALGKDPGLLGSLVANITSQGLMLKHTRDNEQDADYSGIPYVIEAGYDPHAFMTFFTKLKSSSDSKALAFLQSHPLPAQRIANAKSKINSYNKKMPTKLGKEEFITMKTKL